MVYIKGEVKPMSKEEWTRFCKEMEQEEYDAWREREEKLWNYLVKKLKPLKDNNKTAKEVFHYVSNIYN